MTAVYVLVIIFIVAVKKRKTEDKENPRTERYSINSSSSEQYDNDELEDKIEDEEKKNDKIEMNNSTNKVPCDGFQSETESGVYCTYEDDDMCNKETNLPMEELNQANNEYYEESDVTTTGNGKKESENSPPGEAEPNVLKLLSMLNVNISLSQMIGSNSPMIRKKF